MKLETATAIKWLRMRAGCYIMEHIVSGWLKSHTTVPHYQGDSSKRAGAELHRQSPYSEVEVKGVNTHNSV